MSSPSRDRHEARRHFVEAFALQFDGAGGNRMAGRVMAALLSAEDFLTAAELGDLLQASPASISVAVRYLEQTGLAERRRIPGQRKDVFTSGSVPWYEVMAARHDALAKLTAVLGEGLESVEPGGTAERRLLDTVGFFDFMQREMPLLVQRWRAERGA